MAGGVQPQSSVRDATGDGNRHVTMRNERDDDHRREKWPSRLRGKGSAEEPQLAFRFRTRFLLFRRTCTETKFGDFTPSLESIIP